MTCFIPQTHKITGRMKIVLWLQSTASQRRPRQREWDTGTPRALPLCLGSCDTLSVQSGVSSVSSPILLYKIRHISKEIQMMFPMPPAFLYTALQLGEPKHMSDHLGSETETNNTKQIRRWVNTKETQRCHWAVLNVQTFPWRKALFLKRDLCFWKKKHCLAGEEAIIFLPPVFNSLHPNKKQLQRGAPFTWLWDLFFGSLNLQEINYLQKV